MSWSIGYRNCVRQKKLMRLQPELQRLKEEHAGNPGVYMRKMLELYRSHDLKLLDATSLLAGVAQMPLFLGMFHVLKKVGQGVRFLWAQDLLRPDFWFAIVSGVTTALMIMVNPDIPEQARALMIVVPAIIAIVVALKFSSALALYWATSNCYSALQTAVMHFVVGRRIKAGTLKI